MLSVQKTQRESFWMPGGSDRKALREDLASKSLPALDVRTPVLLLGGKENTLSIARHLGRLGIPISVSGPGNCWGIHSRHVQQRFPIPRHASDADYWHDLLLSSDQSLDGHIIWACCDSAIEFIADNNAALTARYIVDEPVPALRKALLDKCATLELAKKAQIGAPRFWRIGPDLNLRALRDEIEFPVMVKPLASHKFANVFGRKLFIVNGGFDELSEKIELAEAHGLEVMIVEMIPGPDSLLSSYYTYITEDGEALFDYTKRVLRRFPKNSGNACYHVSEWVPETAELGLSFFRRIGFKGMGNIEFKRDLRDGKLKIIEANSRFTAGQELLLRSGAPIDLIRYCHLTGQKAAGFQTYVQFLRYWYPVRDFLAFLELRRNGELTIASWLNSIVPYHKVTPLWDPADPLPSLGAAYSVAQRLLRGQS